MCSPETTDPLTLCTLELIPLLILVLQHHLSDRKFMVSNHNYPTNYKWSNIHYIILVSYAHASYELTSCACLEKESALAIMAAVLSSSSLSFCPLSSRAIRARASSPTTPDAAPFMPSMLPGPGMCWARLREAFPAVISPTVNTWPRTNRGNDEYLELVYNDLTWWWSLGLSATISGLKMETLCNQKWVFPNAQNKNINCGGIFYQFYFWLRFFMIKAKPPAFIHNTDLHDTDMFGYPQHDKNHILVF